jgi:hypothetical protein
VPVSVTGNTCRPIGLTTTEPPHPLICATDTELGRDGRAIGIDRLFHHRVASPLSPMHVQSRSSLPRCRAPDYEITERAPTGAECSTSRRDLPLLNINPSATSQ